jgi:hypothetical protein
MPERYRTTLNYDKILVLNNLGNAYANVRFIPAGVYDVDPVLGSTAVPGFTELMTLYRAYRTLKSSIFVSYANQDVFPTIAYLLPMNYDPGQNSAIPGTLIAQRVTKTYPLGPITGNSAHRITHSFTTAAISGTTSQNILDTYVGTATTNPTNLWYWVVGVYSAGAMSAGVLINVSIRMTVDFFEFTTPSN